MPHINDPIEKAFIDVCAQYRICFNRPEHNGGRLDFYLPDFKMYVEVKAYSTERLREQLESVDAGNNAVMVLIGLKAVQAFAGMLEAQREIVIES